MWQINFSLTFYFPQHQIKMKTSKQDEKKIEFRLFLGGDRFYSKMSLKLKLLRSKNRSNFWV